ncbi:MAG: SRPBCC family protein [Pseudomonadota bacterium]
MDDITYKTPFESLLRSLEKTANSPFETARPIPSAVNHSSDFLALEKKRIFSREWVCVGRTDEIPEHGDYLTHTIADTPTIVIRQQDGNIGAFVNACAHRFACLMPQSKGRAKHLTCRYHGWTYNASGQLLRAPYMEMKDGFDISEHELRALHCDVWQGFVYVSLADKPATKLNDVLKPFTDNVVGRFDMACYKTVMRESMQWNANWKNLIENFTESYHVPIAHGKTFAGHKKPLTDYACGEDSDYYGYHYAPQPSDTGPGAAHAKNTRLEGEWRRMMVDFCVFPCHLVTLMPDYLWYISVQPDGVNKMNATWGVAVPPENLNDVDEADYDQWLADFRRYMDVANDEDKPLVEALFKGTQSPLLPRGVYHPIERNLWQFVRYLNRVCNGPG